MADEYIYAVARVRCKELGLLSSQDIDQLMASGDYDSCIKLLQDKGWGDGNISGGEKLLAFESEKIWSFIKELTTDLSAFDILLLPIDFNNLKAVIKSVATDTEPEAVFVSGGAVSIDTLQKAIREKDYALLPDNMREAAKTAHITMLQTHDGQLCDALLDRACLYGMMECGENSDNELLKDYAELSVAIADIKIAVRSCKTHKTLAFIGSSIAPCKTLDAGRLIKAATGSLEELFAYLSVTPYAAAAEMLKKSYSAFEKWCDDKIMSLIKDQKRNPFSIGPLFAYVLARQNEIKMVRIILSGKLNQLDDNVVRERLRDMYV